jgi:hypothetical protein
MVRVGFIETVVCTIGNVEKEGVKETMQMA